MSPQNKFDLVHGWKGDYVGNTPLIGPLSDGSYIPRFNLHDGPQGVANGNTEGAFPPGGARKEAAGGWHT